MATSPAPSAEPGSVSPVLGKTRWLLLVALVAGLGVCGALSWMTRGAMAHLPFLSGGSPVSAGPASLVDLRPWQTAQTLAAMAVTAEENQDARQAEHLADHEVDQAFAAALRQAGLDAQHRKLTGEALALKQKLTQLQQLQKQDQALADQLSAKSGAASVQQKKAGTADAGADALQVAKAQLGLDNDEIIDAQHDLERASGDQSARIQEELAAHEQAMSKYDSHAAVGEIATISVARSHTLASRINAWLNQRQRYELIEQAQQQALDDARALTTEHNALEAAANAAASPAPGGDGADRLSSLRDRSTERQILSIDDDRIQTEQQLASVYGKWAAQVQLQHVIVLHLILSSAMLILFILVAMLLCDAAVRRLMARPSLDGRQTRTLRKVLELAIQVVGVVLVLLVIFGSPKQTPTILGLTTAALTIALQDYIVAFLGWFTLVGKNGIHVGDWVEINGVGGEVIDFSLMSTTLLETGSLAEQGLPTGRHITFMNSFAIRGVYFNFSTAGQWMWDEIVSTVPATADVHALAQQVEELVSEETRENVELAENEWRRESRNGRLAHFDASPVVNLRPSGSAIELHVRYITPAAARFQLRNRLYRRVLELLHQPEAAVQAH